MSEEKPKVKLYKQSYDEASTSGHILFYDDESNEVAGQLELVGMVSFADESLKTTIGPLLEMVNEGVRKEATELGATHVFGIEYQIHSSREASDETYGRKYILASGDAYKPRQTS